MYLFLLTSERAWANAMHMKSAHNAEVGDSNTSGSTKRHIISRLRKASINAGHLIELLEDQQNLRADSNAILEARAYYLSICGAIHFEKQHWQMCLQDYSEARLIYATLATSHNSSKGDLFQEFLNSTIDPNVRFAAYHSKVPRTASLESIARKYVVRDCNPYLDEVANRYPDIFNEQTGNKKGSQLEAKQNIPRTIHWRSRNVVIEDAATAQALAVVALAEEKLTSTLSQQIFAPTKVKAAAYDGILISSQDAVDLTKTAIDELSTDGVPQSDPRMQSLQITRTAVNYALVGWRIGRNRVLCGEQDGAVLQQLRRNTSRNRKRVSEPQVAAKETSGHTLKRLRERVVLYEAIIQSLDFVESLPGVAADESFLRELRGKRFYFQALRLLAMARSQNAASNPEIALALVSRALEYCSEASKEASAPDTVSPDRPPNLIIAKAQINGLRTLLQTMLTQFRALVEIKNLWNIASKPQRTFSKPLLERLDKYFLGPVNLPDLVTYPPKLKAIPVKPIFLDIAYNYVRYPRKAEKLTEKGAVVNGTTESAGGKDRRGWFGFGR